MQAMEVFRHLLLASGNTFTAPRRIKKIQMEHRKVIKNTPDRFYINTGFKISFKGINHINLGL